MFILAALIAIVGFSHFNLSSRMDNMESKIESSIENLANEIRADRRATNQRIDNLYKIHAQKTQ